MTEIHHVLSDEADGARAGRRLGLSIREAFNGAAAHAIVVFASARHDYGALLGALAEAAGTEVIVGSSSAGEFTHQGRGEGRVCAMGLRSNTMKFALGLGHGAGTDVGTAARQVLEGFRGLVDPPLPYRSAMVMTDALAGHTDSLVEELTLRTAGNYLFFGGGAGDDGRFHQTHVFAGRRALSDAVVALEILSASPVGVGVSHGWEPSGAGLRVTEAHGSQLISLNGMPAIDAFKEHAEGSGQKLDLADPLPYFLHNIIGIQSDEGYRLRVPLACNEDGSVSCAAAVPEGAVVYLMKTTEASAVQAARTATGAALKALAGSRPAAAFVFDCVATRLRLGRGFEQELQACANLLGPVGFVGCNTYGQIARAEGQFSGFHNCTAVVCVLPE